MPRTRKSEEQRRADSLRAAVARGRARTGIRWDYELAEAIGVPATTLSRYKREGYSGMRMGDFGRLARTLRLTGREICEAFGVPYGGWDAEAH